ncbi:MAG: PRTRC system protein B [Burkholderiaceae bacterium]|nr:PRTRC system protein B [Burkholderiaceae bacterium]
MSKVRILAESDVTLNLVSALLMYQSNRGDVYATTHPVEIDGDQPHRKVIGAGTPLTREGLAKFASAVDAATAYGGFVPENLLYTAAAMIAWWTPASVRNCWFKCNDTEIGTAHGQVAHPALVFVAVPGDWYVFALRDSTRPERNTRLCHSPHFNVWEGGRICSGNVDLPPALGADAIAIYEDAFFRSHFTHPNRQRAVKYKGGAAALWRDQLRSPDPDALRRALMPAKETLQNAIERIANAARNHR